MPPREEAVRIHRVELRVLQLPLVQPFETSFGRTTARRFVLVTVFGDGERGYGECVADEHPYYSAETTETAWHVLATYLVPSVLGRSFDHPRELQLALRRIRGHPMAKAALEMASWDLYGKLQGQPICRLLGGTRDAIVSGVSIGIQPSLDALAAQIERELAAGYRRIKIKIKPGWDLRPVEMVRRRFGPIPLMVDANGAYHLSDAAHLVKLDDFDLMMIEQPLDYDDLSDHAVLQRQLRTPICLDESIGSVRAAAAAFALGACRIVNVKPGRVGGYADSLALHDLAGAHGVPLWHGGMLESGIGRAHNLHLSTLPNFSLPGDVAASRRYYQPDLIDPPIDLRADGTIAVPNGPGIGVHVVAHRVEAATERQLVLEP
jgi:O-succinylbenzoate synthase